MDTFIGPDHPALLGKTGRGVVVATIDSGIANGHPHVGLVTGGVTIGADGLDEDGFADRLGHGTAVPAAIREKAPDITLLAVRVFHDDLSTSVASIVRGIDWASQRGAHLINLSLGTSNPDHAEVLTAAVDRARARGAFLVSARQHNGKEWLPGCLADVVSVVLDPACERAGVLVGHQDGRPVFRASGLPRPIPGVPAERNLQGISFAVANVTGIVARLLEGVDRPSSPDAFVRDIFAPS